MVFSHSDFSGRFRRGQVLAAGDGRQLTVSSSRSTESGMLVRFVEIGDRNGAEALAKTELFIESADRRALTAGEYWPDELVGLEVRDSSGAALGVVADVDGSSPQFRLLIETSTGRHLIPLVAELVPVVDPAAGYLVVSPVPGLFGD